MPIVWRCLIFNISKPSYGFLFMRIRFPKSRSFQIAFLVAVFVEIAICFLGLYVLSIVWRVSIAENEYLGRSELIPLSLSARRYSEQPVSESFGHKTYVFDGPAGRIVVWRQKINSFQHMYGSAIATYEIGETLADKLFCLNELAEYLLDWNGVEPSDLLDRKKDLANNALGRKIGQSVGKTGVKGHDAELALSRQCVSSMETDPEFLAHYLDPRVSALSESKLGCNCLPQTNIFNNFRSTIGFHRRKDRSANGKQ